MKSNLQSLTNSERFATLPDGKKFPFWDDCTEFARVYHVAQEDPVASDDNPGTEARPFKTINRAAEVLQPGEMVLIHAGVYRECICPAFGGTGVDRMIAYEAAPGDRVVITGAEPWRVDSRLSAGWRLASKAKGVIRMADLPAGIFRDYNPFLALNAYEYLPVYGKKTDPKWMERALLRRGSVFVDGRPLLQVSRFADLENMDGAFWVEEPGYRLHFRLPGDADPSEHQFEISAREQVFAPRTQNLGFIRVSGFELRQAANGLPVPQRGALSSNRGHHWIIEDCLIEWANGCGMDIGCQSWDCPVPEQAGYHIIRRNTVRHCGVCGIAGAGGVVSTLLEDNVIEHVGYHNLEKMWECAGMKFHFCRNSLIRGNVFRHIKHAGGIWLDVGNINNRVTNNVFVDIESLIGAVYSEMNYEINLFDHNLLWDIRRPEGEPVENTVAGSGLHCDCNEKMVCAHNFFGKIEGETILFSLLQSDRRCEGRTGLCWANIALNNVLVQSPHRISIGRRGENCSDGNLFDMQNDPYSFRIYYPEPGCSQDLARWQEFFGLDTHSTQADLKAEFDAETLCLTWRVIGDVPILQPVNVLDCPLANVPGPMDTEEWKRSLSGEVGRQTFPVRGGGRPPGAPLRRTAATGNSQP